MQTEQVTLTTTAARLDVTNYRNETITVRNTGTVDAYWGPSGVTSATGMLLKAGEQVSVDLGDDDALWAVAASTTTTACVAHTQVS